MTAARKFVDWWRAHAAWIAIVTLTVSAAGAGYCVATVQARADHATESAAMQEAYREALAAKDKLISSLAVSTAKAAGQAADAAATAVQATDAAKTKDKPKQPGSNKAKEWTK